MAIQDWDTHQLMDMYGGKLHFYGVNVAAPKIPL